MVVLETHRARDALDMPVIPFNAVLRVTHSTSNHCEYESRENHPELLPLPIWFDICRSGSYSLEAAEVSLLDPAPPAAVLGEMRPLETSAGMVEVPKSGEQSREPYQQAALFIHVC